MAINPGACRIAVVVAGLVAVLGLSGCASPGPVQNPPDDLALEVTVIRPRGGSPSFRRYRCDRYVLLADGSLHWGTRDGAGAAWFPPYRRTLGPEQVEDLWRLIADSGLGAESGEPAVSAALLEPDPDGATCLGLVTAAGRRWRQDGRLDGDAADTDLARLVDSLSALAWARP